MVIAPIRTIRFPIVRGRFAQPIKVPAGPTGSCRISRFNDHRPDVLTYQTEPLEEDIVIGGSITAKLFAATSGTDSDWMVRIIDVYPESYRQPDMSGYQLMISGEPLRGRYRKSFEKPEPIVPNQVEEYSIDLHWNHHCFQKGHRIMVQVSSTWFPVIDRNPQKYVPNIFEAKDSDFQAADQKVYHSPKAPSHMELMIMPNEPKAVGSR